MMTSQTYCDPCTPGTTSIPSNVFCEPCKAGTYASSPGSCLPCPVGTYVDISEQSVCFQCNAGTHASVTGLLQCTACPIGLYSDVPGLSVCKQCPSGTTSDQLGTGCDVCPPGRYIAASGNCIFCPDGKYSDGIGLSACSSCIPGKISNPDHTGCVACGAGTYTSDRGIVSCTGCQAGTYQPESGSSACLNCAAGQSSSSAAVACTPCAVGTYAPQSGLPVCLECTAGKYTNTTGRDACTLCLPGLITVATASTACSVCAQGSFAPDPGGSVCRICSLGTYSTKTGVSACMACPSGTIGNASSSTSCFDCPIGTHAPDLASTVCSVCPAGAYASVVGTANCVPCSAGKYLSLTGQTSINTCIRCDMGAYTVSAGSTVCASCQSGQLSNPSQTGCTEVTPGFVCPEGAYSLPLGGCLYCEAGKFTRFRGASVCQPCPESTGSLKGASQCSSCENNNGCRIANGSACLQCTSACVACGAGKYNDGRTQRCVGCAAGTFSGFVQAQSSAVCSPCSTGYTTSPLAAGQTQCVSCASVNQTPPNNALSVYTLSPLVCAWECSLGYIRIAASEVAFRHASYPNYTYNQALAIFHVQNDYCCNPTMVNVLPGRYLVGCNRSYDGDPIACRPIPNGYYVRSTAPKINYCDDWACNPGAYSNGTVCLLHPVCRPGFTYNRTSSGDLAARPFAPYTCVPCSRCMDGSETLVPCNGTADTQCAKCSGANYSANGSACIAALPVGYIGVRMRLSRLPSFQGRPSVYSDGSSIDWGAIDFVRGFFFNSYAPCRPLAGPEYMYIGQSDLPCQTTDNSAAGLCAFPECSTQCRPWNGSAGWFRQADGRCAPCVYDGACASDQFSNLAVCGPVSPPLCTQCPSILPRNVLRWTNPGRFLPPGLPVCDVVCRDGFLKSPNLTCVPCPNIPVNARIVSGCSWTCSLGFYPSSVGASCIPCPFNVTSCSVGAYLGYSSSKCGFQGQCPCCLSCINFVPNAEFISAGINNGPDTCAVRCIRGYYIDPVFGLDTFDNPVACAPCSNSRCVAGTSYLVGCTATANAFCAPCSACPVGYKVATRCTLGANTTCAPCAPAPPNASWAVGCEAWECNSGFYLRNGSVCAECKQPSDCTISDSYSLIAPPSCGTCIPCDPAVLLPGQCFNGDGQCGATYRCARVRVGTTTSVTSSQTGATSAVSQTSTTSAVPGISDYVSSGYAVTPTNATDSTPAPEKEVFATIMKLTLSSGVQLADVLKAISCIQQACQIKLISKTFNSTTTTLCIGSGCRRLLSDADDAMVIEVLVLTAEPLQYSPVVNASLMHKPAAITATYRVVDQSILDDPTQLSAMIRSSESMMPSSEPQIWLVLLIAVLTCGAGAGVLVAMFLRRDRAPVLAQRFGYDWSRIRINFV